MKVLSLMYNDVVRDGDLDSSGFPGMGPASPARYKVDETSFRQHLAAIRGFALAAPSLITSGPDGPDASAYRLLLTFDDGGASAATIIADALEEYGWKGHFFVVGSLVGTPKFMTANDVRDLHKRGHVVGSHSHSHPPVFSKLPYGEILREWQSSIDLLADLIGEAVTTASVPCGYYSAKVGAAAHEAGIVHLFISHPGLSVRTVAGCRTYDRLAIFRETDESAIARYVRAERTIIYRDMIIWTAKGIAKTLLGKLYPSLRTLSLGRDRPAKRIHE